MLIDKVLGLHCDEDWAAIVAMAGKVNDRNQKRTTYDIPTGKSYVVMKEEGTTVINAVIIVLPYKDYELP